MTDAQPLGTSLDLLRNRSKLRDVYDKFVIRLRELKVGAAAPAVGELFPDVRLPDARGAYKSIVDLSREGPLVLSFNRGRWCPYCRAELEYWQAALPTLEAAGGRFAIITPEVGGRARQLADVTGPRAQVLCDIDNGLALELGLAFYIGTELISEYRKKGIDLPSLYGNDSHFLPVPATFIIRTDGIIDFAFVDPDFRSRAEPDEVARRVADLRR